MIKVVINECYGGFSLSQKAMDLLDKEPYGICRHDPDLVQVVELLGKESWGPYAKLTVKYIKGDRYRICEYDGMEWVETPDTIQWIT